MHQLSPLEHADAEVYPDIHIYLLYSISRKRFHLDMDKCWIDEAFLSM